MVNSKRFLPEVWKWLRAPFLHSKIRERHDRLVVVSLVPRIGLFLYAQNLWQAAS